MAGVAGGSGVPLSPKSGEHRSGRESTAVNGLLFSPRALGSHHVRKYLITKRWFVFLPLKSYVPSKCVS